ncbi:MAG: MATE family efflux transporter [Clostridiaceae bacterium]|nr:MATE family efflux transporter [Clostridiaceae bacterium]
MKEHEKNNEESLVDPTREAFLTKPLGSLMIKNILPAVASMLFMTLYQMVDAILVGRRLGPEALASVNILYPILAMLSGLAIMIGVGGNAKIAVFLGKGETNRAGSILSVITMLGIILGIGGSGIVSIAFPEILKFLGTSGRLGYYAGEYLNAVHFFFTPMILIFILEQSVRNDGRPNMATGVMASTAILNIILDYLFLFPLNMGIAGAALATGISQSLGAMIFLGYFIQKTMKKTPGLSFATTKGSWEVLGSIAINGSSELFNSLALGVTTFLYNRLILSYVGAVGVAAFTLVQYLLLFGLTVFMGMGNGIQPIISYNHGAGLSHRVLGVIKRLMAFSLITSVMIFVLLRWQAEALVVIFIPNHPETLTLTLQVAKYLSWSILFMPVGIIGSVYFTALEEPGKSLIVAVCRGLVFTLIGLAVFPRIWGEVGIWMTPVFAEGITALVAVFLLYKWMGESHKIIT